MSLFSNPDPQVEKLMSFRRAEFEAGLHRLTGTRLETNKDGAYILPTAGPDAERVLCMFQEAPDQIMGGLLHLPRARVTLDMSALSEEARKQFLIKFDQTFQRGGG